MELLPRSRSLDDWMLALAWCTAVDRTALTPLVAFDLSLADMWERKREPQLFLIRLAWWREQLEGKGGPSADPVLIEVCGTDKTRGSALLILDGWEEMADATQSDAALNAHARLRAQGFADAITLLPIEIARLESWALREHARRCGAVYSADHCSAGRGKKSFIRVLHALLDTQAGPFVRIGIAAKAAVFG